MTADEYGGAYRKGYILTLRFLVKQGLPWGSAQEIAQAAWVRGWEKVGQLRDSKMVVTWINTIALNSYRSSLRRQAFLQELPDVPGSPETSLAAIDVRCLLKTCKNNDRLVLQRHYLEGYKAREIADAQGWSETAVRLRLLRARRTLAKKVLAFSDMRG